MKNAVTHIKCERAKRPREQHLKIDVRHVDELLKGVDTLQNEQFKLENKVRELEQKLAAK